jgi:hypothetical protein
MKGVVGYEIYLEKFGRGNWHKEILDRKGDDFCAVIQSPSEPWYAMTSSFSQKNCPFAPGHVESFDHAKIASAPPFIPHTFIGKYRCTMKYFFNEGDKNHTDCAILKFDVTDA